MNCVDINLVSQLKYDMARNTVNELRQLAKGDTTLAGKTHVRLISSHDLTPLEKISKFDRKSRSRPPGGVGVRPSPGRSASNPDSDSSDDSAVSEDEEEPSPLPATRPTDPLKAAEYDAMKAVWHTQLDYIEEAELRLRLAQFPEAFLKVRNDWKAANEALKHTEKKSPEDLAKLKEEVQYQRQIVEAFLTSTTEHGHQDILTEYVFPFDPTSPSILLLSFHDTHHSSCHYLPTVGDKQKAEGRGGIVCQSTSHLSWKYALCTMIPANSCFLS